MYRMGNPSGATNKKRSRNAKGPRMDLPIAGSDCFELLSDRTHLLSLVPVAVPWRASLMSRSNADALCFGPCGHGVRQQEQEVAAYFVG